MTARKKFLTREEIDNYDSHKFLYEDLVIGFLNDEYPQVGLAIAVNFNSTIKAGEEKKDFFGCIRIFSTNEEDDGPLYSYSHWTLIDTPEQMQALESTLLPGEKIETRDEGREIYARKSYKSPGYVIFDKAGLGDKEQLCYGHTSKARDFNQWTNMKKVIENFIEAKMVPSDIFVRLQPPSSLLSIFAPSEQPSLKMSTVSVGEPVSSATPSLAKTTKDDK